MQKIKIENEMYNIHKNFLIKTDRTAFIAAYIAYDILENATRCGGVPCLVDKSRFSEMIVCCACGHKMQEEEREFVCRRCNPHNRMPKETLTKIFRVELKLFLDAVREEIRTIRSIGIQNREAYIMDYQDRFDLRQKEQLDAILQNDELVGIVGLKPDALLEEAAQFQCAITKITPEYWERRFEELLEKLLSCDISDDLIEMQLRCVVIGEKCNQNRSLNIGYTLPWCNE